VTIPFDLEGTFDLPLRRVVVGTSRYDHGWLERARALFSRRDDVHALSRDAFVLYLVVTTRARAFARERQVLDAIIEGKLNKQIAAPSAPPNAR
jgi:DNA-binding NarL/FixJ family response regulator